MEIPDAQQGEFVWLNPKLRYNPQARHTTRAQKKEILRRDAWCCSTPGCPNKVWLHLHHLKPYSQGGKTERENLLCLCAGCHRNHHKGELQITATPTGKLVFRNQNGQRLANELLRGLPSHFKPAWNAQAGWTIGSAGVATNPTPIHSGFIANRGTWTTQVELPELRVRVS